MKKRALIILLVLITALLTAGCGDKEEPIEGTWVLQTFESADISENDALSAYISSFDGDTVQGTWVLTAFESADISENDALSAYISSFDGDTVQISFTFRSGRATLTVDNFREMNNLIGTYELKADKLKITAGELKAEPNCTINGKTLTLTEGGNRLTFLKQ